MAHPVPVPPLDPSNSLCGKVIAVVRTSAPARVACYEALWQLGVRFVMLHPNENPVFQPYCAAWITVDTDDVSAMEAQLRALMKDPGGQFRRESGAPDGIICFDEFGVLPATQLCARFRLRPQPFSHELMSVVNSKGLFRDWCFKNNVASPQSISVSRGEVPSETLARVKVGQLGEPLQFPFVVKASHGAGKMQTKLVHNNEELDAHADVIWTFMDSQSADIAAKLAQSGNPLQVLVEEYIGGQEVDLDCIVENGKIAFCCVADNFATKPPYFSEMGGLVPSGALDDDAQLNLIALLDAFLRGHGDLVHGCLHFEAKYDPSRVRKSYVIEVNGRMGGAETFQMTRTAYGVDLAECVARLAVGLSAFDPARKAHGVPPPMKSETVPLPVARCYCASVNILPPPLPPQGGRLTEVRLPTFMEQGLVKAQCISMGFEPVLCPPQAFYCVVWMVAWGKTAEEAKSNIDRLTAQVHIRCEPLPAPVTEESKVAAVDLETLLEGREKE